MLVDVDLTEYSGPRLARTLWHDAPTLCDTALFFPLNAEAEDETWARSRGVLRHDKRPDSWQWQNVK